jgi:hypothetical protein
MMKGGKGMKRLYALAVMFCLAIFLVATANAAAGGDKGASAGKKAATEVGTSDMLETPQGLNNLKKVMNYRIERSKKIHAKIDGPRGKGK